MVRVPKAAGAVIDPGIRKSDPAIARQIALPIAAPNGLPRGLLPVLQTGVANAPLIAQQSGLRIAEAIALLTVALTGTQTVLKNATWSAQTIAIVEWIEGRIVLRSVVPMVGIDP